MSDTYIIIPVYNRKDTTIRCLDQLKEMGVLEWAHVVVVDDASPDGTGAAIRRAYSEETVTVLTGDGNLWWAGGIKKGMEYAYGHGAEFMFWLNDDCRPNSPEAIKVLIDYSMKYSCISVGRVVMSSGTVYTGRRKGLVGFVTIPCAEGEVADVEAFGGNAVCIPRLVVDSIGYPDEKNFPMMADTDYGLMATKAGIRIAVVGRALFENDDNLSLEHESFLLSKKPTSVLLKATFLSIKSFYYLPSFYKMRVKHFGVFRGNLMVLKTLFKYTVYIILRTVIPRNTRIKIFGRHLRAWKIHLHYNSETEA